MKRPILRAGETSLPLQGDVGQIMWLGVRRPGRATDYAIILGWVEPEVGFMKLRQLRRKPIATEAPPAIFWALPVKEGGIGLPLKYKGYLFFYPPSKQDWRVEGEYLPLPKRL